MANAEILTIGNEILLGLVQDTNSNYLCRVVRGMGGRVRHIAIVRDVIDDIADAIKAASARKADLIFTCGGLGPTDDDLTLAAISKATDRPLELNPAARELVASRYKELASLGHVSDAHMNDARLKMARLPRGARPVENTVGAAPAVILDIGNIRIISLPGVPAELKTIVEGPLQGVLEECVGSGGYRECELTVDCGDESRLAPALREVASIHPGVYIKSRASHFGPNVSFRILVSASAASGEEADRMIAAGVSDLLRILSDYNIRPLS